MLLMRQGRPAGPSTRRLGKLTNPPQATLATSLSTPPCGVGAVAGSTTDGTPGNTAIGSNSFADGDSTAVGVSSKAVAAGVAVGTNSLASAFVSTAVGFGASAGGASGAGTADAAFGFSAKADSSGAGTLSGAFAAGFGAQAIGGGAVAIGGLGVNGAPALQANAVGNDSTAVGASAHHFDRRRSARRRLRPAPTRWRSVSSLAQLPLIRSPLASTPLPPVFLALARRLARIRLPVAPTRRRSVAPIAQATAPARRATAGSRWRFYPGDRRKLNCHRRFNSTALARVTATGTAAIAIGSQSQAVSNSSVAIGDRAYD